MEWSRPLTAAELLLCQQELTAPCKNSNSPSQPRPWHGHWKVKQCLQISLGTQEEFREDGNWQKNSMFLRWFSSRTQSQRQHIRTGNARIASRVSFITQVRCSLRLLQPSLHESKVISASLWWNLSLMHFPLKPCPGISSISSLPLTAADISSPSLLPAPSSPSGVLAAPPEMELLSPCGLCWPFPEEFGLSAPAIPNFQGHFLGSCTSPAAWELQRERHSSPAANHCCN